jgi:hypothetical protein
MTTGKLYRIPGTDSGIYAVEEGSEVKWTKFNEDYAEIKNMRNDTKQGFESIRFNVGYEDDINTAFTVSPDRVTLTK